MCIQLFLSNTPSLFTVTSTNAAGSSEMPPPATTTQESIVEKTAEIAHKMNMETWQLVAILVGK